MISVCIATYNGEKYIKAQLESILPQLSSDDEIVISDDSSSDATLDVVHTLNDPRIVVLSGQTFRNPIFNFENALRHAKGDFLFLTDQDDVWLPQRVAVMMTQLKTYDLVVSDCVVVNENLETIYRSYFERVKARPGFFRNLVHTSPYIGCCMAFNRALLSMALPFPKGIPMHDFWIAMLAEARFKIKFVNDVLVLYRRHSENASFTTGKSKNSLFTKITFRMYTLRYLIPRILR